MKRPKVGDRIIHDEPEFERITQGVVMDILSSQFTYQTDNGLIRFCFYKDIWKHERKTS
tara:strand:- start:687 stop:863 length:177 start_codon:yes stop_codon:yes gene_type:complete